MELKAKIIQILPLQTGEGKNGTWRKQEIIVETDGQIKRKICVSIWGDKINESILKTGNVLNISFDIESREYNGRWYTDVKAWKTELAGAATQPPDAGNDVPPPIEEELPGDTDLPF
ncbi:MAG: hypothetical protein BWY70_00528 [Bacteroidetes bacterium ADurb.Bin408]|nr:MAG: hypothetical protein BWY70_00528 [Bacteroidetes bacterium ADurb.Bin408]